MLANLCHPYIQRGYRPFVIKRGKEVFCHNACIHTPFVRSAAIWAMSCNTSILPVAIPPLPRPPCWNRPPVWSLGSSTLCWHCFKHNRELLALRHYASTIGKNFTWDHVRATFESKPDGKWLLVQVVLAIGTLVTLSLGLAMLYLCYIDWKHQFQSNQSWPFLKSIIRKGCACASNLIVQPLPLENGCRVEETWWFVGGGCRSDIATI